VVVNTTLSQQHRLAHTTVAEAMHSGVIACERETPLDEVAATMARKRVHCVVVDSGSGEGREPWGIVSDLDLVAAATVRELEEQTAGGTAATPILVVRPDDTLERAAQLMTEHTASHLVVVDPLTGRPVGVLSTIDLATKMTKDE
jgi:CBS domain-containing protein